MDRLDARIGALIAQKTLTRAQGDELRQAGEADLADALAPSGPDHSSAPGSRRGAVLEVLGYVGAALLLGAASFTGFLFWNDLPEVVQKLVSVACVLVPGVAGAMLTRARWREHVGEILASAALCATLFPWYVLVPDVDYLPYLTLLIAGAVGVVVLRHWAFLVPVAVGGISLVLDVTYEFFDYDSVAPALGLWLVAIVLAAASRWVNSAVSWSLAGLTGWTAASYLFMATDGAWWVLGSVTVMAVALFLAFIRRGTHATAAIGSLMILIMWPLCLSEIFGSSLGVAIGLMAAGTVLIATVVVLSRRKATTPQNT